MQKIKLWSVESSGSRKATAVADIDTTETEQQLEDLLVNSPDLLMDNLTLVGRQLPTEGGPLDLLGVDADGRLVLFELKRGTLTRDAVAQALDYASDLAVLGEDKFARLIDEHSGQNGIEAREGFADWYQQEFQNEIGLLTNPPKIVLVGLGADERARRIVNFLAQRGIEIQLLTFHGFTHEGKLFLARQVESIAPTPTRDESTMLWLRHEELLTKLDLETPLIDLPEGPTFDSKMQSAETLLPDATDDVKQVAEHLRPHPSPLVLCRRQRHAAGGAFPAGCGGRLTSK